MPVTSVVTLSRALAMLDLPWPDSEAHALEMQMGLARAQGA